MTKLFLFLMGINLLLTFLNAKELKEQIQHSKITLSGKIIHKFKNNSSFDKSNIEQQLKDFFSLSNDNVIHVKSKKKDRFDIEKIRVYQTYKGILIEDKEAIIHLKDGKLLKIVGDYLSDVKVVTKPYIKSKEAITIAIKTVNAEKYMWEDNSNDNLLKKMAKGKKSYIPNAKLVIDFDEILKEDILCYKVNVLTLIPFGGYNVYVDAISGDVVKKIACVYDAETGTGNTLFNGSQTIFTTRPTPTGNFELYDDNLDIETIDSSNSRPQDADNIWNFTNQEPFVSAHWATNRTYDYFHQTFGLDSYDGNGARMTIKVTNSVTDNAYWTGTQVLIGEGSLLAYDYLTTLDLIGHEWAHGVTQNSAGLIYSYESGALNESFSDIFGTMVEFFASDGNYDLGEDVWIADGKMRNMANPNEKGQPDTYNGTFWYTGADDHGGVHTNSGVQNYWFYLLAEGGNGVNDNGDSYTVHGIGREKAASVAYRNLTSYLTSNSDYDDAREFSIEAATDLYRERSFEVAQTTNAWYSVGVGDEFQGSWIYYELVPTIISPLLLN